MTDLLSLLNNADSFPIGDRARNRDRARYRVIARNRDRARQKISTKLVLSATK